MIATLPADEARTTEELVAPVIGEIRMLAPQAEASRRLQDALVACLKQAGLLSIYTPKEFGGLVLTQPAPLRVVEEVASPARSSAWIVALCVATRVFTSVLSRASAA